MAARLRVRLFAHARTAVGAPTIALELPPGGSPLVEVRRRLGEAYPALRALLPACRFVRNGTYISRASDRLRPGDELSIHPPYSGG